VTKFSLLFILTGSLIGTQSPERRKDIPAIARDAAGCIVSIIMSDKDGHPVAQGSGFLISKDGRVVTNYHVIENGTSAIVKLPDGAFFIVDGVLASDKDRDVAIIKAHGENFRTLKLGNSDRLQVGEQVVAIGNPLFLESTVSNGIVSGIRTLEGGKFLQVTTPISPGSSGGPLFNMAGEVVGITTLYLKGGENLNFAIPINDVKPMLLASHSKLYGFPDESEASTAPTTRIEAPSALKQTPIDKQQSELYGQVGVVRFNVSQLFLWLSASGAPLTLHDTSEQRKLEWRPQFDQNTESIMLFDTGSASVCPKGSAKGCRDINAPADMQAHLSMEALRDDWVNITNTTNIRVGKYSSVDNMRSYMNDMREPISSLWAEEKTLYCMMRPEAKYIDLYSDTMKSCTPEK